MPKKSVIEPKTKLGIYIAEEAHKRNLSYRGLSQKAGLDEGTLAHIVSGRRTADVEVCVKLAEYLKVDPCYLLELAGRIPARMTDSEERPGWMRNIVHRLSTRTYPQKTVELIEAILNQADKELD